VPTPSMIDAPCGPRSLTVAALCERSLLREADHGTEGIGPLAYRSHRSGGRSQNGTDLWPSPQGWHGFQFRSSDEVGRRGYSDF
jgi:hypothetical protein